MEFQDNQTISILDIMIAMIHTLDIDRSKAYNDPHGHQADDDARAPVALVNRQRHPPLARQC